MAAPIDLLCVGLTTLDITVRPVESLPEGETGQIVEKIALSPAGTAGGSAFVAQTLGLRTALSSAVGDDPQGQIVRSMLDGAGVDTSMLAIDPNWPTSTTVLPIRPNGDRPNWHMMGASIFAPVTEAEFAALDRTRNVHWAAVGFPGTMGKGADFLREAQARGVFTSCDLIAPTEVAQSDLDTLLPHVDLFMPSLAEMRELAGTDDPVEGAHRFMARGAKGCLVKLGERVPCLSCPTSKSTHPRIGSIPSTRPVAETACAPAILQGARAAWTRRGHCVSRSRPQHGSPWALARSACSKTMTRPWHSC